jgi:multidrug transporter EmrE-like cation transporter
VKDLRSYNVAMVALLSSIAFGVAGQLLMKLAALRSIVGVSLSSVSVLALALAIYSLGVVFWMVALRWLALSVAYPVTSLSYIGVLWGSWYWFSESVSALRVLGVTLIFIGVTLIVWNKPRSR